MERGKVNLRLLNALLPHVKDLKRTCYALKWLGGSIEVATAKRSNTIIVITKGLKNSH